MRSDREKLCDLYLERVTQARTSYVVARNHRQSVQDESPHLPQSDGGLAFRRALEAETLALSNWGRALNEHHDLIVKGEKST